MKIIDKRGTNPESEQQEQHEKVLTKKVKEPDETLIQVNPDSRMRTQLTIIKEDQPRWENNGPSGRKRFLEAVIKDRGSLDELEIMDYNYKEAQETAGIAKLACRVYEETLAALRDEARAARLGLDEYMRALTYTYAKKSLEEKRRKDKEEEEQRAANTPTHFDIALSKPLQATLLAKYPLTEQEESNTHVEGFFSYVYMKERLMKIIEEALED